MIHQNLPSHKRCQELRLPTHTQEKEAKSDKRVRSRSGTVFQGQVSPLAKYCACMACWQSCGLSVRARWHAHGRVCLPVCVGMCVSHACALCLCACPCACLARTKPHTPFLFFLRLESLRSLARPSLHNLSCPRPSVKPPADGTYEWSRTEGPRWAATRGWLRGLSRHLPTLALLVALLPRPCCYIDCFWDCLPSTD